MNEQVKEKAGSAADKETTQHFAETQGQQPKKKYPKRGKRYSRAQKDEILNYSSENSIAEASAKFDVSETTIYDWIRTDKRRNNDGNIGGSSGADDDPTTIRDNKILAMWRQHPGYGPSQIRNMLKRSGFKVSVGTVRHVMEENGYLSPKLKRKEPAGRYEAARPKELYHLDFYHFYVHKQKTCILFIEDDFSRFIAGWTITPSESSGPVIECFEQSVQRYGRPRRRHVRPGLGIPFVEGTVPLRGPARRIRHQLLSGEKGIGQRQGRGPERQFSERVRTPDRVHGPDGCGPRYWPLGRSLQSSSHSSRVGWPAGSGRPFLWNRGSKPQAH